MDEQGPMQFVLVFLVPLTMMVLFMGWRRRRRLPLPPGPRGLPIIGNMLMMDQLNHRGLAKLADRYGGLLHLRLGLLHAFAVSTPDVAQQVLQVQDLAFANRPAGTAIRYLTYDRADMAFAHYGPFWRQMRKLCVMRLFSRRRAESWAAVREEVDSIVRTVALSSARPVNVGELIFNLTMNIIFRAAFGTATTTNQGKFISILQEFSKLFGAFNLGDFFPMLGWLDLQGMKGRLEKARGSLDRFIDDVIEDHMANPKPKDAVETDMVDDMLVFLSDGRAVAAGQEVNGGSDELQGTLKLTKDNIKAIIMDVMFGGTETVASAIEWALAELMHNPSELHKVQSELLSAVGADRPVQESDLENLPYLRCCIKETLRLHPPIPLLLHETSSACEVSGYHIPAKSRVMINVWAIGRDRAAWAAPEAFRPERFAAAEAADFRGGCFEFLPFGSGRRSCPGMQLGLYGLEMAVASLLHCFEWELPDGMKSGELDMEDVVGLTAPRKERLVAVPTPRLNCALV